MYPFRFRDPLTRKWVRARHKMQIPELQRAYSEWEITGAPQVRHVMPLSTAQYNPFAAPAPARAIIAPMLLWMRSFTTHVLLVGFGCCFLPASEPLAQQYSLGTGFFVSADGYIATCKHVVEESSDIAVRDRTGKTYAASVELVDSANDLAILKVNVKNAPALPIRRSSEALKGDEVFTLGYPCHCSGY